MISRKIFIFIVVGLMISLSAQAQMLVLSSGSERIYQRFVVSLNAELKDYDSLVEVLSVARLQDDALLNDYDVIVAVGVEAAKALAGKAGIKTRVIYALLPESSFAQLQNDAAIDVTKDYVLFLDQPPQRYVHLAKLAMPDLKALAVLYGDVSQVHANEINEAALQNNIDIIAAHVLPKPGLLASLRRILEKSEALLVLPDPYLYNRRTVQGVLLSSFRFERPLIAYSESYVDAGALLAIYSTPEQVGKQAAEIVTCLLAGCSSEKPALRYPSYFSIKVNEMVARKLDLKIDDSETLERRMMKFETDRALVDR